MQGKKLSETRCVSHLTQSDSALPRGGLAETAETFKTRLGEACCYLLYPFKNAAHSEIEWSSAKVPSQDGLLSRASRKLGSEEALLSEIGPVQLNRDLQKYLWRDKESGSE